MSARRVTLLGLLALAEASVIAPVLLVLPTPLRLVDTAVALFVIWMVLGGIASTRRLLARQDATWPVQRAVLGVWLVGLLVASVVLVALTERLNAFTASGLFIEFAAVLLLWWRGMALGTSDLLVEAARLHLQVGLILFVVFAVVTAFDRSNNLVSYVVPFLAGAVFAMPLSHLEWIEQHPLGRHVTMDRHWWGALALDVGGVLLVSLVIAMLVTGDALAAGARLVVLLILLPLVLVFTVVAYVVMGLLSLFVNTSGSNPLQALQDFMNLFRRLSTQQANAQPTGLTLSTEARFAIGLVIVIAIIAIVLWLMDRARREAAALRRDSADLQNLEAAVAPDSSPSDSRLVNTLNVRRWLAALTVRRIYARMTHEARKRGFARLPAQTPNDYIPILLQAFPAADADVRKLTAAYVAAHYGEVPDTPAALAEIRAAWERIRVTPLTANATG